MAVRVAHFDCFSGISGDMTLAALIDAGASVDAIRAALDSLELPIRLETERVKRNGIAATKVNIVAEDQDDYRFLPDVEAIIARGNLTPRQRELARAIFHKLAEAEATVHGIPVEKVHFHEVGALDSIADIIGTAVGVDLLQIERFTARSVIVGSGMVKCAHGLMPVPAPATAVLLSGMTIEPGPVKGELTTPTGAAILATLVQEQAPTAQMTVTQIGHGAGTKDPIEVPNVLRLFVGESATNSPSANSDSVWVLETNLDDCPGEVIGYTLERLLANGALDAFAVPVQMKKNRPGVLLTVLATEANRERLETVLFRETGTFGIRRSKRERSILQRETVTISTKWGPITAKKGWRGDGFEVLTPEFEDCARIAREHSIPLREVYAIVLASRVHQRPV